MKNTDFRNALHYISGAVIAFLLSLTFQGSNFIPELIVTLIVTIVIASFWEIGRKIKYGYEVDKKDVIRTVAGAVIFFIILKLI